MTVLVVCTEDCISLNSLWISRMMGERERGKKQQLCTIKSKTTILRARVVMSLMHKVYGV